MSELRGTIYEQLKAAEARLADAERELVAVRLAERLQGERADALEATAREVRVAAIRTSAWWCVAYLLALGVITAQHWPLAISLAAAVAIVSGRREWRRIRRTDRSA